MWFLYAYFYRLKPEKTEPVYFDNCLYSWKLVDLTAVIRYFVFKVPLHRNFLYFFFFANMKDR